MPGTVLDWGHWKSGGIWVDRPGVYFSGDRPEKLPLELTPPPLLMQAFDGDLDALVHHMRPLSEDGLRALRDARTKAPLGAQKLVRMHPWMEPKTLAESGGRPVPSFKIGARGLAGRRMRGAAGSEVHGFRHTHELSRRERLAGKNVEFPYGTHAMRVFHNVPIAEPLPDAIVAQPGPLSSEVLEAIRERRAPADGIAVREQVLEEVRGAWRDEASEVLELDTLDFVDVEPRTQSAEVGAAG